MWGVAAAAPMTGREQLARTVASVITAAWAVGFVWDMASKAWELPAGVYGLMTLVAGWLFVAPAVRRNGNGGH